MKLDFIKMQGCGNDYIYFDCFSQKIEDPENLSIKLSDRHYGIGGDGIILICPSDVADAKMRMFNLDGTEGKMCGNGIRCVGKYLYDTGICKKKEISIETLSGIKFLEVTERKGKAKFLTVDMGKPELKPELIPVDIKEERIVNYPIKINDNLYHITCVSMGNPHCVVFCANIDNVDVEFVGPFFERNKIFPEKVNVEFVQVIDKRTLAMRVFERGSGETLACGTGACAAVVAAVLNGHCEKGQEVSVCLKGGILLVSYTDETVYMKGNAKKVFKGAIKV